MGNRAVCILSVLLLGCSSNQYFLDLKDYTIRKNKLTDDIKDSIYHFKDIGKYQNVRFIELPKELNYPVDSDSFVKISDRLILNDSTTKKKVVFIKKSKFYIDDSLTTTPYWSRGMWIMGYRIQFGNVNYFYNVLLYPTISKRLIILTRYQHSPGKL